MRVARPIFPAVGRMESIFAGKNELLDLFFHLIIQLVTVVPEKFDAVIFIRVVRSGENDAGIGTKRTGNVSHTGRRQWTDDEHIDPERSDPCNERVLEHVARTPGVFAEHNLGTRSRWILAGIELRENVGRGTTQFQRCLSCDWFDVSDTADAVGPKNFLMLSHGLIETLEGWFVNGKFLPILISEPSRRQAVALCEAWEESFTLALVRMSA